MRVKRLGEYIGQRVGADLPVVCLASLLHDIGITEVDRKRHFEKSAELAKKWLEEDGFPNETIKKVVYAIEVHSRYGGSDPETKEAKVLYDADILDTVGAIGLVRAILRWSEQEMLDVESFPGLLEELIEKQLGELHFEESKRLAKKRIGVMRKFLGAFEEELGNP